jgi:alkylation response protein AidB-like acyl-CoA dehydrogenase
MPTRAPWVSDAPSGGGSLPPWICASRTRTRPSAPRLARTSTEQLDGDFAGVRGRGGPGDEHALFEERLAWEQRARRRRLDLRGLAEEHGGRGLPPPPAGDLHEEYARAGGPGRAGHIGEGLLGPTSSTSARPSSSSGSCPPIAAGTELWCQGYSEPNAGSDLANVQTRAELDGDEWVIDGQKVWTSLAHWSDWVFVICRTDRDARSPSTRASPTCLVPMRQPGRRDPPDPPDHRHRRVQRGVLRRRPDQGRPVVGGVGNGWKVAMGTLAFERGA